MAITDDAITVGDPNTGLDNFFGRLNVDAGPGHNRITFDESASLVHDVVTLTATQVIPARGPRLQSPATHFGHGGSVKLPAR